MKGGLRDTEGHNCQGECCEPRDVHGNSPEQFLVWRVEVRDEAE